MKKRNYTILHMVTFFFVLIVNINAYGTKKASELTSFKSKDTVSFARRLFEMMAIDTKFQDGKYVWYYNQELLCDKDKEILLNLEKLDELAKQYGLPIALYRHGVSIEEDKYQDLRTYNTKLDKSLNYIKTYLKGINKHRTPSCPCLATNTDYSFNIKNTQLCKTLITHKVISEDDIKKTGNKDKTRHIKLLNEFCFFISSMFVEKVKFKDMTTAISNLANKTAEELFPEDKRTQNKIKEIKKELEQGEASTSQEGKEQKSAKEIKSTEAMALLERGGEKQEK